MSAKPSAPKEPPRKETPRKEPARAWQRMLSGRRLDLLDPSPLDIEIEDIAHGLARVARWNGQTQGSHAFSVAQHSVLVEMIGRQLSPGLGPKEQLAIVLHDAAEYVIGDMISPFKAALGMDYKTFETRLQTAIHLRFGLPATLSPSLTALMKSADRAAAFYEATRLAGFQEDEALRFFGRPPKLGRDSEALLAPLPTDEAKRLMVQRVELLSNEIAQLTTATG
jgi:5'-deoxynucleotidase YfbR-like HD superfamily hydrolase